MTTRICQHKALPFRRGPDPIKKTIGQSPVNLGGERILPEESTARPESPRSLSEAREDGVCSIAGWNADLAAAAAIN